MKKQIVSLALAFVFGVGVAFGQASLNDPALFQVPEIKTVAEAQNFLREINGKARPLVKSQEDQMVLIEKMADVFTTLGDKVLALAPADDAVATGYALKFQGAGIRLAFAHNSDDAEAKIAAAKAALEKLIEEADAVPEAKPHADDARAKLFMERVAQELQKLDDTNPDHRKVLFLRLKPIFVEQVEKYPSPALGQMLSVLIGLAEDENNPAASDAAASELIALFTNSPDARLKKVAASAEGERRRNIGKPFAIKGKTVAGDDFDWEKYKGKIVLIDFWASWCGPCIGEVPNMIKAYEQFKDKGFEIVSIGVWDENDKLKKGMEDHKMTWVSLSEDLTTKDNPDAAKFGESYGVQGIPTMFLVGRDGKIIVTDTQKIRGPNTLIKTLEEIIAKEEAEKKK
ncbi:MAG: TlpA family protein disulfide reductase [Thermoguttaceae bacterium]